MVKNLSIKSLRLKIGAICPFLDPYSIRLLEAIAKVTSSCQIIILTANNQEDPIFKIIGKKVILHSIWRRGTCSYPLKLLLATIKSWPHIVHIQFGYTRFGRVYHATLIPFYLLALSFLKIPSVVTMHHVIPKSGLMEEFFNTHSCGRRFTNVKKLFVITITTIMGMLASKMIVHTRFSREVLQDDYHIRPSKIIAMPYGATLSQNDLSQSESKARLGLKGNNVILFFGYVNPYKGVEYAIKALAHVLKVLPNTVLLIAGNPEENHDYVANLEDLVRTLNLKDHVIFTKRFISDERVETYFTASDVVVLPYIKSFGASGVLMDAASYGKAVVATDSGRFNDVIINQENGLLVPPKDSLGLANAIRSILLNPILRQKLEQNLWKIAAKSPWEFVAKETLDVYFSLLSREKRGQDLARAGAFLKI